MWSQFEHIRLISARDRRRLGVVGCNGSIDIDCGSQRIRACCIDVDGDTLTLGALTTYREIRASVACREHVPALVEAAATIGAAQIQQRGTLGGNIANASPAGDTLPVLLAADASIVIGSSRDEREIAAAEFWTAYRQTALAHDELVVRVRIPLAKDREMRFRKVGTRRAQSISKVMLAVAWRGGEPWTGVRVALGSVAATPIRASATEAALEGASPTPETADRAAETLANELAPIDDVRATAGYRRVVAARILHRVVEGARDEARRTTQLSTDRDCRRLPGRAG